MNDNEEKGGYVFLEKIVYDFLSLADKGEDDYRKVYQIALKGYKEMQRDVSGGVATALINVLANKVGRLPADYSNWVRVGVLNSKGELATLTRNDQLTTHGESLDDRNNDPNISVYTVPDSTITDIYNMSLNGRFPYWSGGSLGIGSLNNIGEFKIDKTNGYIIFDPGFQYQNVIMEYVSDPAYNGYDYLVDTNIEDAIFSYIVWMYNWLRKDVSRGDKYAYRAEYYNQKRLSRSRMNPLTAQDISDSYKKFIKEAPRN